MNVEKKKERERERVGEREGEREREQFMLVSHTKQDSPVPLHFQVILL